MTIKWATKLRKGTRKKDRNRFAEKGLIFGSRAEQVLKAKTRLIRLHPKNISHFPSHFDSMLICGKPVQLIRFCIVRVKLCLP